MGLTVLSWAYLVDMALDMGGMAEMAGMEGVGMGATTAEDVLRIRPWSLRDFGLMSAMWAIMMVGMMVPTAVPMVLIFAAISRKAAGQGQHVAHTGFFVTGYIGAWTGFSLLATLAQWGLDQAALLSPMMVSTSPALGAGLLIAAGLYQLTPWKDACLDHCRTPAHFISHHWRDGGFGAFRMGVEHGLFCLGCCWVLMGLLFFGGVMNLLWIVAITGFVLLEKVLPVGRQGGRIAGGAMIAAGLLVLVL